MSRHVSCRFRPPPKTKFKFIRDRNLLCCTGGFIIKYIKMREKRFRGKIIPCCSLVISDSAFPSLNINQFFSRAIREIYHNFHLLFCFPRLLLSRNRKRILAGKFDNAKGYFMFLKSAY